MQLTITTDTDQLVTVDLSPDDSIENLRAVLEAETGVPPPQQRLIHNGRELPAAGQTLGGCGLQPHDLLMLLRGPAGGGRPAGAQAGGAAQQQQQQQAAAAAAANPSAMHPDGSAVNPELLMNMLEATGQVASLGQELRDAVRAKDVARFQAELRRMHEAQRKAKEEEERLYRLAQEDPFNPEVQRKLMEAIEAANVQENFDLAYEHNPEAFSSVCMLYVNMEVNGIPLKAFIDSGAQMTIMSRSCAERCNLLRLMDRRWEGMAVGVGSAKILGRIHMVQLKAGGHFFPVSITVLDQDGMEFLFGLDNLKRHRCSIDLQDNVLRFPDIGGALPFLPEHEIPKQERHLGSPEKPGPSAAAPPAGGAPPAAAAPVPAVPGGAAPAAAAPGGGGLPAGWDEKLQRLQALGFSREQCLAALRSTGGNEEMAGALLFS